MAKIHVSFDMLHYYWQIKSRQATIGGTLHVTVGEDGVSQREAL